MSQVDPWEKAADCERALRITVDPIRREILSNIREFWIALAGERPFLSEEDFAAEIEVISDFHATLDPGESLPGATQRCASAIFGSLCELHHIHAARKCETPLRQCSMQADGGCICASYPSHLPASSRLACFGRWPLYPSWCLWLARK